MSGQSVMKGFRSSAATALMSFSALAFAPAKADHVLAKPVQFTRGALSATIKGSIKGYQTVDYTLRDKTGQTMRVVAKSRSLADSQWQLLAIQSMDDAQGTTRIADPGRFTVQFGADGRASFRLDCKRATATWTVTPSPESTSGSLVFGPIATTKMMCRPGSRDQRVLRDLLHVRSCLLKDGKLYLSLVADGGIREWRPVKPRSEAVTPKRTFEIQ